MQLAEVQHMYHFFLRGEAAPGFLKLTAAGKVASVPWCLSWSFIVQAHVGRKLRIPLLSDQ
jgi:hypothetical protein